jgi:hypothetical protein
MSKYLLNREKPEGKPSEEVQPSSDVVKPLSAEDIPPTED